MIALLIDALEPVMRGALPDAQWREGTRGLPAARLIVGEITDWGTKTEPGHEVRIVTTITVGAGQVAILDDMADAAARAGTTIGGAIGDGWHIGSAILTRMRMAEGAGGTRIASVEHRIRLLNLNKD